VNTCFWKTGQTISDRWSIYCVNGNQMLMLMLIQMLMLLNANITHCLNLFLFDRDRSHWAETLRTRTFGLRTINNKLWTITLLVNSSLKERHVPNDWCSTANGLTTEWMLQRENDKGLTHIHLLGNHQHIEVASEYGRSVVSCIFIDVCGELLWRHLANIFEQMNQLRTHHCQILQH